jgi:ubiquinone/menaquinone biosynthesis C-methylase UbiE
MGEAGGTARDGELEATYDAWSGTYDGTPNPLVPFEEVTVRSLLRTIAFEDVLDAATGTGRHALYLAGQGKRVAAVDCSEGMLAQARSKAAARGLSIDFRLEDLGRLSFEDGSFDLVLCALALAHIENLAGPCAELLRVLRPGGHLILTDLHPFVQAEFGPDYETGLVKGHGPLYFPNYHADVADYTEAVEAAGGRVVAALDVAIENKGEVFPGVLVVWARKG